MAPTQKTVFSWAVSASRLNKVVSVSFIYLNERSVTKLPPTVTKSPSILAVGFMEMSLICLYMDNCLNSVTFFPQHHATVEQLNK